MENTIWKNWLQNEFEQEIAELILATLVLAFGLTIFYYKTFEFNLFLISVGVILLTFIPHELAHKYAAQLQDIKSRFKLWKIGSLLALLTPFMGFFFAAPGFVELKNQRSRKFGYKKTETTLKQFGLIAIAGPLTNILIGIIILLTSLNQFAFATFILKFNFFLAFLNLLPIPPLDGYKVMQWKPLWWFIWQIISIILVVIYY